LKIFLISRKGLFQVRHTLNNIFILENIILPKKEREEEIENYKQTDNFIRKLKNDIQKLKEKYEKLKAFTKSLEVNLTSEVEERAMYAKRMKEKYDILHKRLNRKTCENKKCKEIEKEVMKLTLELEKLNTKSVNENNLGENEEDLNRNSNDLKNENKQFKNKRYRSNFYNLIKGNPKKERLNKFAGQIYYKSVENKKRSLKNENSPNDYVSPSDRILSIGSIRFNKKDLMPSIIRKEIKNEQINSDRSLKSPEKQENLSDTNLLLNEINETNESILKSAAKHKENVAGLDLKLEEIRSISESIKNKYFLKKKDNLNEDQN